MESLIRPHLEAGRFLKAQQAIAAHVDALQSPAADQLAEAAYWYCQANDFTAAATCYQRACEQSPEHATYHYNLATTLRITGDIAGAQKALDRHISKQPSDAEAYWLRVQLARQSGDPVHISRLMALTTGANPPKQRVHAWYALGKVLEDSGDDAACFNAYQAGANLRRQYLKYEVASDKAIMQAIERTFSRQWFEATPGGHQGEGVVFIVGMPRSGTTLVENLLGAHTGVAMGGELNAFASAMMAQVAIAGQPGSVQASISQASQGDFRAMGQAYQRAVQDYRQGLPVLTDKLPLNFLYLGLIAKALPAAKIIHVRRDPMDTIWSVYKHLFAHAYPFSYQLNEIAEYYKAYRALMAHWEGLLGNRILSVSYESLARRPADTMRNVANFCDLSYDDACLNFYQRNTSVTTGSAVQVREPVNTRSIGQWQRFSSQLAKVRETLVSAGLTGPA